MMKKVLFGLLALLLMSSLSAEAVVFKKVTDLCVVKYKGEWYVLKTRFVAFDEFPQLQQRLTKQLFGKENTSIRQAFHDYMNGFDAIKSYQDHKKAKGKEIQVEILIYSGNEGRFVSFMTGRTMIDGKGKKTSEGVGTLIFDVQSERILGAEDILAGNYLKQYKILAGSAELQFMFSSKGLFIGMEKNDRWMSHTIFIFEGEQAFTDEFKKLIGYQQLKEETQKRDSVKLKTQEEISQQEVDGQKVYDRVEQMPNFPGGYFKMREFINDHHSDGFLPYSKTIKEGRVDVEFIVEKDGSLSHIKVIKSVSPECDNNALAIIKKMPRWSPGLQKGQPVRVRQVVNIDYKLRH